MTDNNIRLDTIPQNKFPRLYEALHRQARRDAMIARIKTCMCYAVAVYIGSLL